VGALGAVRRARFYEIHLTVFSGDVLKQRNTE
jgi:hypothetical protein